MANTTAAGAAVVLAGVLALAGCASTMPAPVPSQTSASTPASPAPSASSPAEPVLVEGGTAEENQPYFDKVNLAYFAANGTGSSVGIVDNLVAAGFRKQDMQVTINSTSIDIDVDSRIFSVRLKGECLIGDIQASGYKSIVAPLLGTGDCLIGTTVPLN